MANHVIVQLATLNSLSYAFVVILHEFFRNGIKLEKVLKYKYLGNIIEASGKLNSSFTELSKKGAKVLFSIFKYLSPLESIYQNI
jgi:hypothetical protein